MRKSVVLVLLLILFLLTGCTNNYQVSELKVSSGITPQIEGLFKNNTNKKCSGYVYVEIISGTLIMEESIPIYNAEPNEIQNISGYCSDCGVLSNAKNYDIKVKKITCK